MEFNGPKFCLVGDNVEFKMVLQKKSKNISFIIVNPEGKQIKPNFKNSEDFSVFLISFEAAIIGFYKINVIKNVTNQSLASKTCFVYDLNKENWNAEFIHWSLNKIEIILEMKLHQPLIDYISAQSHLLSTISNSTHPNVVIKCSRIVLPDKSCKFIFTPPQFGSYEVRFFCNGVSSPDPRPQLHVINTTKWKLIHSFTTDKCLTSLKKKASFIFELGGSPSEFLKAWVKCPDKSNINMLLYGEEKYNKIGQLRCDFTPTNIGLHSLIACYEDKLFEKCPLEFYVYDGKKVDIISIDPDINSEIKPRVGETFTITYKCLNSDNDNLSVTAIASEDSGIYSDVSILKSNPNSDGIVKFSMNLQFAGQYLIEGFYKKEKINFFEINVLPRLEPISQIDDEFALDMESDEEIKVINENPNLNVSPTEEASKSIILSATIENASVNQNLIPTVTGDGLTEAEIDKSAMFTVNPCGESGKLTVDVAGPKSLAKCLIKPESTHGCYDVEYYPKEIGLYHITILWNEHPLPGSPFKVEVTDPKAIQCISHPNIFTDVLHISFGKKSKIDFSYSLAGNGRMSASINKNKQNKNIKSWVSLTKTVWTFWIESSEICEFTVDVFWNNINLGRIQIKTECDNSSPVAAEDPVSQIVLKGPGLKEAWVGEITHFVVDAINVNEGELQLNLSGTKLGIANVPVVVEEQANGTFECKYVSMVPGDYLLHISWGDVIVKGSPFPIKIWSKDPSRGVECSGDGLKHGLVGETSIIDIDISNAFSNDLNDSTKVASMLSVTCFDADNKIVPCTISQVSKVLFRATLMPLISGRHLINILFYDSHVPKSPFYPFYTDKEALDKIKVFGPGLKSNKLKKFESYFTVDTTNAGVGKLRVQVKGPKEAFRVEVQRNPTDSRLIKCSYNPTEIGEYMISISWSGCPIKGSPFMILLD